jgi:DNA mismatch repair protein MutS2
MLEENRPRLATPHFPDTDELETQLALTAAARSGSPPGKAAYPWRPSAPAPLLDEADKEGALLPALELRAVALWIESGARCAAWLDNAEAGDLTRLGADCRPASTLYRTLLKSITASGDIDDAGFPALRALREEIHATHQALSRALSDLINSPEAGDLFQERLVTVRDGRYVVPLKAGKKGKLPGIIHNSRSASGETFFLEPLDAVEKNNRITTLLLDEQAELSRILRDLTARLRSEIPQCRRMHHALLEV